MGDNVTQRDDRVFQVPQRRRILAVVREAIDLFRQLLQFPVDSWKLLRWSKAAQSIANFAKSPLDICEGPRISSCIAAMIDALSELVHLLLDRFHRFTRHRILQHDPDLGEVVTQRIDGFVDAAGLEFLDLSIDLAELLLET